MGLKIARMIQKIKKQIMVRRKKCGEFWVNLLTKTEVGLKKKQQE
jgi:hypothetical protein